MLHIAIDLHVATTGSSSLMIQNARPRQIFFPFLVHVPKPLHARLYNVLLVVPVASTTCS